MGVGPGNPGGKIKEKISSSIVIRNFFEILEISHDLLKQFTRGRGGGGQKEPTAIFIHHSPLTNPSS